MPLDPNNRPRSSDNDSAFALHPIGWIHRRCRRLPAAGVGLSANAAIATFPSKSTASPTLQASAEVGPTTSPPPRTLLTSPNPAAQETRAPDTQRSPRMPFVDSQRALVAITTRIENEPDGANAPDAAPPSTPASPEGPTRSTLSPASPRRKCARSLECTRTHHSTLTVVPGYTEYGGLDPRPARPPV